MKISNGSYYTYFDGSKEIEKYSIEDVYDKPVDYSNDCENFAHDYLTVKETAVPNNCVVDPSYVSSGFYEDDTYYYYRNKDKVGTWHEAGSSWYMEYTEKSISGWRVENKDPEITEITSENIPCSSINGENIVSTSYMFTNALHISKIDLSKFYTNNITNMQGMFFNTGYNSNSLELNLLNWNTSNVTDMSFMFKAAGYEVKDTFKLSGIFDFNTSNVKNMSQMFESFGGNEYKKDFVLLDLSKWNVSNVTNMYRMFTSISPSAPHFSLGNISKWDTSNVTNMARMFANAGLNAEYELDLSKWNVSNVKFSEYFNATVDKKIISPNFN